MFPAPRRVPPRRAGNFHLSGQIKVTKAKALNTSDLAWLLRDQTVGQRPNAPSPCPAWRLRPARCPMKFTAPDGSGPSRHSVDANALPPRPPHQGAQEDIRVGPWGWACVLVSTERRDGPDPSGTVETMSRRACAKAPDWAGRRRIWPSTDSLVAWELNMVAGVEAPCFGDFHSGQRMKVTRPPGRIPGRPSRESR